MKKEIITFGEWYKREPNFSKIYDECPILNLLYPDAVITWAGQQTPPLSLSSCVFHEAEHRFNSRYVYVPYLVDADNYGQIMKISADIMYHSLTEWNRYDVMKQVLNKQMTFATLQEILGNYSLTKEGGWTDTYNSEKYTDNDTYAKETGRNVNVSNFQSTNKVLTTTTINHDPANSAAQPALTHEHVPDPLKPSKTFRQFDGGGHMTIPNYHEFGQRMGDFYKNYKDLIQIFPNSVDMFLTATAQCYLVDVYDTNMWCDILADN